MGTPHTGRGRTIRPRSTRSAHDTISCDANKPSILSQIFSTRSKVIVPPPRLSAHCECATRRPGGLADWRKLTEKQLAGTIAWNRKERRGKAERRTSYRKSREHRPLKGASTRHCLTYPATSMSSGEATATQASGKEAEGFAEREEQQARVKEKLSTEEYGSR